MGRCRVKVGDKYNFLTVIEKTDKRTKNGDVYWKCLCECGNETYAISSNITSGHTKSCGCYAVELSKERMTINAKDYRSRCKPKKVVKNEIIDNGDYIVMICSNQKVLIDKEDYIKNSETRWFVSNGYCCNSYGNVFHRLIMNAQIGQIVDHINGNRLDNRRNNLRFVTASQNGQNRKVKGITYDKKRKKWNANIVVNGKRYYLGRYQTEEEALLARKNGEIKYQGEYRYNGN